MYCCFTLKSHKIYIHCRLRNRLRTKMIIKSSITMSNNMLVSLIVIAIAKNIVVIPIFLPLKRRHFHSKDRDIYSNFGLRIFKELKKKTNNYVGYIIYSGYYHKSRFILSLFLFGFYVVALTYQNNRAIYSKIWNSFQNIHIFIISTI